MDDDVFYKISSAVNIPTINRINAFISDNNNDYTIFCYPTYSTVPWPQRLTLLHLKVMS